MEPYGPIVRCQSCSANSLRQVIFLGFLPPVNTMRLLGAQPDQETWLPAEMLYCDKCHLVQLGYAADPRILFPPEYPYTSGTTKILRDNFAQLRVEVDELRLLEKNDLVVDIGSNDGTLLSNFTNPYRVLGIEPTNAGKLAASKNVTTWTSFFNAPIAEKARAEFGPAKVITATNVFAHIHGIHEIIEAIAKMLGPDGVFVSESHYLRDLVEGLQYDTIYHEHLRYYSVTSLKNLLAQHGFRVFHVRRIPTHGGSVRVYATKSAKYAETPSVRQTIDEEAKAGLASPDWISSFRDRIVQSREEFFRMLDTLDRKSRRIYGIGAPSRASTLIHYLGLDDGIVEKVMEVSNSQKLNKYMPGSNIPVVDEAALYKDQPAYALLLSWHIFDEVARNLKRKGFRGDFLMPLTQARRVRNAEIV